MAELLTPTTELEAVNAILRNAGESRVNTLEDAGEDVSQAYDLLIATSREVQSEGWWFNTDNERRFLPTDEDRIVLPANTLKADPDGSDRLYKDYVLRGNVFYDRKNHTYDITEAVTVRLVQALNFDELPETARRYITLRAARIFQEGNIGDIGHGDSDSRDENRAWAALLREDISAEDSNMLTDSLTMLATTERSYVIQR